MPKRETKHKSESYLDQGGINERVQATELPRPEWSQLRGVFPDFNGEQGRLWGKFTLNKFAFPVYNITQFWTPVGYPVGLYQFSGTVDFGIWVTPISKLVIPTLPPPLNFDGGGFTLDPWGYGFNEWFTLNYTIGDFLLNGVGTPDGTNGSPGGTGRKCRWTSTPANYNTLTFQSSATQVNFSTGGTITGPTVFPPLNPSSITGPYLPGGNINLGAVRHDAHGSAGSPPTYYQEAYFQNNIAVFDFSAIVASFPNAEMSLALNLQMSDNAGLTSRNTAVEIDVDFNDILSYSNYVFDISQYLPTPVVIPQGGGGTLEHSTVSPVNFTLLVRHRICQ